MHVYLCVRICTRVQVPVEIRREHRIPWSWGYRGLRAINWVLGIRLRSTAKAVDALNCSPAADTVYELISV